MSKNYVVSLPQFHVEADSKQEAAEQAIQTFLDYTSSRNCDVREFGKEYTMKFHLQHHRQTIKLLLASQSHSTS